MHKVLSERSDVLLAVFGKILRQKTFKNSIYFCYRLIVYSWRRSIVTTGGVKTTPQMTRFRDAKVCNNWLQKRIGDHRIQSDYKYKSELQNQEGKKSVLGITSAWWHRARQQWQRDHQDPEHLQHSAHEHWHVSAQFSCLLVRLVSSWFTLHRLAQGSRCCACNLIHACDERFSLTLSPPFSSTSSSSHSSSISCTSSRTSSTSLRAVANLCTPPKRVWTLLTTLTPSHKILRERETEMFVRESVQHLQ